MDINRSTTVNKLLNEYPQLKQVLIDLEPKLKKPNNPILLRLQAEPTVNTSNFVPPSSIYL